MNEKNPGSNGTGGLAILALLVAAAGAGGSKRVRQEVKEKITHLGGKKMPISNPFPIAESVLEGYGVPVRQYPVPGNFEKWSKRREKIDSIILHYTSGQNDKAWDTAKHAVEGTRRASFHFAIGKAGDIVRLVPENVSAWQCESWNQRGIGIEHCAYAGEQMSPEQEKSSVLLIKHLIEVYGILPQNIKGHRFARLASAGEKGAGETDCPGDLFGPRSKDLARDSGLIDAWLAKNGILRPPVA